MGNLFLHALVVDLKQTQRTLLPHCFFCVPQPRSLLVDKVVNQGNRRLGEYCTLNDDSNNYFNIVSLLGKQVRVLGSHVDTKKGFYDLRQIPDDPNEKTLRLFKSIQPFYDHFLRTSWCFTQLDEKVHTRSLDNVKEDDRLQRKHGGGENHLLQLQQTHGKLLRYGQEVAISRVSYETLYSSKVWTPVLRRKREVHFLSLLKRRHHKYTFDYHFLHLNTTALGFIIANFQVAIEYFLKRKDHKNDCKVCLELASQDGNAGSCCFQMIPELNCVRAAYKIR
ncbi:hypothetical protein KXD40_009135 [Peronospora effusa]|uniref:Uncharacterized protein n=1 Tax=Peronospora effusa TaxID=542832 RepID=A0A3M6VQ32_9STRA|nr:hypothetical protein DD238_007326 [Peronospora effusa]RQM16794.1 hypothetical protein DD237_000514 [Peronospora effusa]UIZ25217.1 hypothetical protein KXD40_009135 [Peronospora effusa]